MRAMLQPGTSPKAVGPVLSLPVNLEVALTLSMPAEQ